MGRGAYDTTSPAAFKSAAAMGAIKLHNDEREKEAKKAAEEKAAADLEKLIRSKKSRGIKAAKKAAKEAAKASKKQSENESDATVKP